MNSYVVEIPQDEIGAYIERKRRLENERLNLYFVPRTQLVDSINISNETNDNIKIGYAYVSYIEEIPYWVVDIDENTSLGPIAIELMDSLISEDLINKQTYVDLDYDTKEPSAILRITVGRLGSLQEEFYSVYFTGTRTNEKSLNELAKEVLNGEWGEGFERKQALTEAGYDYRTVQNEVNKLVLNSSKKKSIFGIFRKKR